MTIFAISNDNYITVFDSVQEAQSNPETEHFSSLKELGKLAAQWPAARLIEIWNNPARRYAGEEVHGSEDGGYPDLEADQ
jgi:hypothetical protein